MSGGLWEWCRVYHQDDYSPAGTTARAFGPMARFDPHRPTSTGEPQNDPDGRTIIYLGANLATSAREVFGEGEEAPICPAYRVALIRPLRRLRFFDIAAEGSAMAIGGLPALGNAPLPRLQTAEWARAIYEDDPLGVHADGIKYISGYNSGDALAVWDSAGKLTTAPEAGADMPLNDAGMLGLLKRALIRTSIVVREIPASDCKACSRTQ